ncbi:MAG: hypothetical protein QM655_12750 [Nocardioidaceae bacterium]
MLAAPVLAACSTNFNTPTDQDYIPAAGISDRSGNVDVLNALVVTGSDGSGTVVTTLVNNTATNDRLTAVTVDGQATTLGTEADTEIPATGTLKLPEQAEVFATGANLKPGSYVSVSFTFANAEAVTVSVPLFKNEGDYASIPVK